MTSTENKEDVVDDGKGLIDDSHPTEIPNPTSETNEAVAQDALPSNDSQLQEEKASNKNENDDEALDELLRKHQDSLEETESLKDKLQILDLMGRICLRHQQVRRAVIHFTRQLEIAKRMESEEGDEPDHDPLLTSKILINLARLYQHGLKDSKKASRQYAKALKALYSNFGMCHEQISKVCKECKPRKKFVCERHSQMGKDISSQIEKVRQAQAGLATLLESPASEPLRVPSPSAVPGAVQHRASLPVLPSEGNAVDGQSTNQVTSSSPPMEHSEDHSKFHAVLEKEKKPQHPSSSTRHSLPPLSPRTAPRQPLSPAASSPELSTTSDGPLSETIPEAPASPTVTSPRLPGVTIAARQASMSASISTSRKSSSFASSRASPRTSSASHKVPTRRSLKRPSSLQSRRSNATSSSKYSAEAEGFEVSNFDLKRGLVGSKLSVAPTEASSPVSTVSTPISSAGSLPTGPSRVVVVVWFFIGFELVLDLFTSGIAVISLTEKFECCGETIDFSVHGARLLGITVPFFVLVYVEFVCLALSIKHYLAMTPRQREADAVKRHMYTGCLGFLGSNWRQQLINLLLTFNPFFGFCVAYLLLYNSNRTECLLVMGLEAGSIVLKWASIYLEGLPVSNLAFLWHMIPVLPFGVTVLLILNYLDRGGVCYFVQDAYFWYEGCLICANGTLPGENGLCEGGGSLPIAGDYCGLGNETSLFEDDLQQHFCFFGMTGDEADLVGLFKGSWRSN